MVQMAGSRAFRAPILLPRPCIWAGPGSLLDGGTPTRLAILSILIHATVRVMVAGSGVYRRGSRQRLHYPRESIADAYTAGLSVLVVLNRTPCWAQCPGGTCGATCDCSHCDNDKPPVDPAFFYEYAYKMATEFGTKVGAWELWNEPDLPNRWKGTRQQYRDLILIPGYNGLRDGLAAIGVDTANYPKIVAPALGTHTNFVDWLANPGQTTPVVPIHAASFHVYGSATAVKDTMNNAIGSCSNALAPICGGRVWLTEWGFNSPNYSGDVCSAAADPIPGDKIKEVMAYWNDLSHWNPNGFGAYRGGSKLIYFTLHDRWQANFPGALNCDIALLTSNGTARAKAQDLKAKIEADPNATCP